MELESPTLIDLTDGRILTELAQSLQWRCGCVTDSVKLDDLHVAMVVVDEVCDVSALRRQFPNALMVSFSGAVREDEDLLLPQGAPDEILLQLLAHAQSYWRKNRKVFELVTDVAMRRQRMHQLNEISMALTAEMPQQELLQTILREARRIAQCEGSSLYLIEAREDDPDGLVFKLGQNDAVDFHSVESRLPLTSESIAGYVAVTGYELNIQDVYRLQENTPYRFNRSFDEKFGY